MGDDDARFVLAVLRVRRTSAGCSSNSSSAAATQHDSVDFFLPRAADDADALVLPSSPTAASLSQSSAAHAHPLVTTQELLACAQILAASLSSAASVGGGGSGAIARGLFLDDDNGCSDDEEEEIFNREVDAIGFRDLHLGHADARNNSSDAAGDVTSSGATTSPTTAKRLLGAAGDETGIFFHLPQELAKALRVMGIAVPDPQCQKAFYVQQDARFVVLCTNVPFHAYLRARLQEVAAQFFHNDDDDDASSLDVLTALYRELTAEPSRFADLPYRELFVGLPVLPLLRRLGTDVVAVLRVLLLEGRIVCYSSSPSLASSATLALLALLPGVLAVTSCDYAPRTTQAVVYRLRRVGLPFSLFNEDVALQPCFTAAQAASVYAATGFVVGTSDPLLLRHPNARLDVVVNLDLRKVVAFPTQKTECAFAVGPATAAFADAVVARVGCSGASGVSSRSFARVSMRSSRTQSMRQSVRDATNRAVAQLKLTPTTAISAAMPTQTGVGNTAAVASAMQSTHSELDWVLAQFESYFERLLDDGFHSVFSSSDVGDAPPPHTSIRALLGDLARPVVNPEHAAFYAEYGRAWTHAWQTTSSYDSWLSAHRLARRRSTIAPPHTPPPQDGHATYTYANGDEYDGSFMRGKRNGFGVYVEFVTKHQYEGDWVDDARHGQGVLSSKHHGYIYDGAWRDDMRSGRGHSALKGVESYTGEWLANCFHGHGVYTNANGDVYDGEWRNGVREGVGKLTVARPQRTDEFGGVVQYSGEWRRGKFHGTGTAQYADTSAYSGGWADGQRHGNGALTLASGDRYDGQWWKGYRHGEGSAFSAKSGDTREGTWRKDAEIDGVWFIVYANGDKYSGACRRGRPWGDGVCKYATQSSYSGSWVDGLREGYGVCVNADGSILEGEWKHSVFVRPTRAPSRFVDVSLAARTGTGAVNSDSSSSTSTPADRERQRSISAASPLPVSGEHAYTYANGDTYDGAWMNSERHGFGVFTERATGNVYEGEWVRNTRHGSGVLTSGLKDFIYDGAWVRDERCGYGHCVIRGCETYSGQWQRDQFHGTGTYIDAEGHAYDGEFVAGQKHGVGKQVFATQPTKEQYSGEWKHGARDGLGDAVFADGATYSGSWRHDVRDGEGTFVAAGGGDTYVGQWRNGLRDGAGIVTIATTGVVKEGVWSHDEPVDGEWTIQFPDGSKFTGACVNGRPHGRGVCKYANGDLYDGEWVSGKRHGVGTGFFANGESFVGEWENNHVALNGRGKLTLADGTVHVYAK